MSNQDNVKRRSNQRERHNTKVKMSRTAVLIILLCFGCVAGENKHSSELPIIHFSEDLILGNSQLLDATQSNSRMYSVRVLEYMYPNGKRLMLLCAVQNSFSVIDTDDSFHDNHEYHTVTFMNGYDTCCIDSHVLVHFPCPDNQVYVLASDCSFHRIELSFDEIKRLMSSTEQVNNTCLYQSFYKSTHRYIFPADTQWGWIDGDITELHDPMFDISVFKSHHSILPPKKWKSKRILPERTCLPSLPEVVH